MKRQRRKKLVLQHGKQLRKRRNKCLREVKPVRQKLVLRKKPVVGVNKPAVRRVARVPYKREVELRAYPLCDVVKRAPPVLVVRRPQLQVRRLPLGRRRPPDAVRQLLRLRRNAQQRPLLKRKNKHYVLLRAVRQTGKLKLLQRKLVVNQQPALKQRVNAPKRQLAMGRQQLGKKVKRRAWLRTPAVVKNVREAEVRAV